MPCNSCYCSACCGISCKCCGQGCQLRTACRRLTPLRSFCTMETKILWLAVTSPEPVVHGTSVCMQQAVACKRSGGAVVLWPARVAEVCGCAAFRRTLSNHSRALAVMECCSINTGTHILSTLSSLPTPHSVYIFPTLSKTNKNDRHCRSPNPLCCGIDPRTDHRCSWHL